MKSDNIVLSKEKRRNYFRAFETTLKIFRNIVNNQNIDLDYKKVAVIIYKYDKLALCLKEKMGQCSEKDHIDSHKISSLFLILMLKYNTFINLNKANISPNSAYYYLSEIYFAFIFGIVVMESMYNIGKSDSEKKTYKVNKDYGKEFAKMVYANKRAILSPTMSSACNDTIKGAFCLSHIFYFIEQMAERVDFVETEN